MWCDLRVLQTQTRGRFRFLVTNAPEMSLSRSVCVRIQVFGVPQACNVLYSLHGSLSQAVRFLELYSEEPMLPIPSPFPPATSRLAEVVKQQQYLDFITVDVETTLKLVLAANYLVCHLSASLLSDPESGRPCLISRPSTRYCHWRVLRSRV